MELEPKTSKLDSPAIIPKLKRKVPKKIQLNEEENEQAAKISSLKNLEALSNERKVADISAIGKLRRIPSKGIEVKDIVSIIQQENNNQNDSIILQRGPLTSRKKANNTQQSVPAASPRSLYFNRQQSKEEMKRLNVFDEYHNVIIFNLFNKKKLI